MQAPSFSLPDQYGIVHTLQNYIGKWLILYFYPKDETKGCTEEACAFRDGREVLADHGFTVVGVSRDSVASHKVFAERHDLQFILLSDEAEDTMRAYGVIGEDGRPQRTTFLIDPSGGIYKTYAGVDPQTHIGDIMTDISTLRRKPTAHA